MLRGMASLYLIWLFDWLCNAWFDRTESFEQPKNLTVSNCDLELAVGVFVIK